MNLVLDAGAVSALAEGDPRVRRIVAAARAADLNARTSASVVAEVTGRGERDAPTNRVLAGLEVVAVGERLARIAGVLRHRSGVPDTVDALVVATAVAGGGGVVLTGDTDDIGRLVEHATGVEARRW